MPEQPETRRSLRLSVIVIMLKATGERIEAEQWSGARLNFMLFFHLSF